MLDRVCNVLLTATEVRKLNSGSRSHKLQSGDRCGLRATEYFRIYASHLERVIIFGRCEAHCKDISRGLPPDSVTRMTYDEALVCEIHDA